MAIKDLFPGGEALWSIRPCVCLKTPGHSTATDGRGHQESLPHMCKELTVTLALTLYCKTYFKFD